MAWKTKWDEVGKKEYETGCDRGVLYKANSEGKYVGGVGWNGLIGVDENPSGADTTKIYANNGVYGAITAAEEYSGTINAYMYPDEFAECDGSKEIMPGVFIGQQARATFAMCYRTNIGNDTEGENHDHKLHFIYGAKASPSSKSHSTINESPEAVELSWEFSTTPVPVTVIADAKPTATIEIIESSINKAKYTALLDILYGTEGEGGLDARLPLPDELFEIIGFVAEG